ncbi:hypothetical protein [Flagellimonas sp. CMM7]|uniref:hypothetical protein n=1 Tax=Flagellimonas sp. CMM7 TaxID=2654676 RepID=UPI0013D62C0A|nr:hypothetical protein [Flagellimonas sp. CMM7]UII79968.1 hypothetical protein LV704_00255 [Flagellimonas sp. CMM7]
MLQTCLLIQNLQDEKTANLLKQKLEKLGFVANVSINLAERTINFEYATFRYMDSVRRELCNMGHAPALPKKALTRKRKPVRAQTS